MDSGIEALVQCS